MANENSGLLDFLGTIGEGLVKGLGAVGRGASSFSAGVQAGQGNVGPLIAIRQREQMEREQERQQNLIKQLQSMSQQEMSGPFGETLKRQLQFGDIKGAQKTLVNIPRYREMQVTLQNPKLGLSPETQAAISSLTAIDPDLGARALQQNLYQAEVGKRKESELSKTFAERRALEDIKSKRKESQLPGNIVASAIENKEVDPTDVPAIVGLLQAANVPNFPTNENDARIYVSRILNSPRIKKLIPKQEAKSFTDQFMNFFRTKQQQAPQEPMSTPVPKPGVQQPPALQLPPGFKIEQIR